MLERLRGQETGRLTLPVLRTIVITLLLALSFATSVGPGNRLLSIPYIYYIFATAYLCNAVFLILTSRYTINLPKTQIYTDMLLSTVMIYATDGVLSPYTSLYMLVVISAGATMAKRASIKLTMACSMSLGLICGMQFFSITPFVNMTLSNHGTILSTLLTNILGFFILWMLTFDLADKLKSTGEKLEENKQGFAQLQSFHENIVNSMSGGLLTTDLAGRITSFNMAAETITGYKHDDVVNMNWCQLFDWPEIKEIVKAPELFQGSMRIDREFTRADNIKLHLGVTASSLRDKSGRPTGVIGIFQDLTHIKQMEENVKRNEHLAMIGEFAAGIAHEIRNPLASLSGSMQILKETIELDGSNEQLINIALKESDRLNDIITEFLSYANTFRLNIQRYDINSIISETVSLLKNHPDFKGKSLIEDFETNDNYLNIDIDKMKQVFWNLTLNALQAMKDGGRLEIKTRIINESVSGKKTDKIIEISFKDDGQGIPDREMENIFTPFYTTKEQGSGLGLAIAARIVDEHHGQLTASNCFDAGAEFVIKLPA